MESVSISWLKHEGGRRSRLGSRQCALLFKAMLVITLLEIDTRLHPQHITVIYCSIKRDSKDHWSLVELFDWWQSMQIFLRPWGIPNSIFIGRCFQEYHRFARWMGAQSLALCRNGLTPRSVKRLHWNRCSTDASERHLLWVHWRVVCPHSIEDYMLKSVLVFIIAEGNGGSFVTGQIQMQFSL